MERGHACVTASPTQITLAGGGRGRKGNDNDAVAVHLSESSALQINVVKGCVNSV